MKKILVIEDEPSISSLIIKILASEGFDVMSADTGLSGVQMAYKELPDLILCDIMLPFLDGYGILKHLRQNPATAVIPFIFLTGLADRSALRLGMKLGADDYLTKPFTRQELLDAIATRFNKQEVVKQQYTTALKQAAEQLNQLIHYDSLTNLPNRLLLREQFNQTVQQCGMSFTGKSGEGESTRNKPKLQPLGENQELNSSPGAFCFLSDSRMIPILSLSLDRFEWLNRTLGSKGSDLLLQALAERLILCAGDSNSVARLDTSQFAIIVNPTAQKQNAADVAQNILNALSLPFLLNTQELFITVSIGIAVYPEDGCDLDHLLDYSLAAMHGAKNKGGNCYEFYTAALSAKSIATLELESSLHYALERNELQLYYQPKVDVQTLAIVGAEALIRWQHPTRGMVSPVEFIPIAEETGLIVPIGQWVLLTACRQAKIWHDAGFQVSMAVNLSAYQFNQPDLSYQVVEILEDRDLEPKWLELELTESILVQNPEAAIATLKELKGLGIQISVDDFGTGYSSLTYLKQFPFDTLKIDRSFVCNLINDAKNAAITTALIQLAHSLNLTVIAEGVETEAELAFLRQHHCDAMQGYLFSPPVPPPAFELLLKAGKQLHFEL